MKENMIQGRPQLMPSFFLFAHEKSLERDFLTEGTENLCVILFQINLLAELKIQSTSSLCYLTIAQKRCFCADRGLSFRWNKLFFSFNFVTLRGPNEHQNPGEDGNSSTPSGVLRVSLAILTSQPQLQVNTPGGLERCPEFHRHSSSSHRLSVWMGTTIQSYFPDILPTLS